MTGKDLNFNRSPRFRTNFPAMVESEFACFRSTITNLSTCGLQFECEYQALNTLMPNITRPNPHLPIQFHLRFEVATTQRVRTGVDLICSLVYARRLNHQTACVGCQFSSFEGDSQETLLEYINHFGKLC